MFISSHILGELSNWQRIALTDNGRIVKEISAMNWKQPAGNACVEVTGTDILARVLDKMGIEYRIIDDRHADIFAKLIVSELALALEKENCRLISVQERDESLESYYVNLVGGGSHE